MQKYDRYLTLLFQLYVSWSESMIPTYKRKHVVIAIPITVLN